MSAVIESGNGPDITLSELIAQQAPKEQPPTVTLQDYTAAVESLTLLAFEHDCSGADVAAEVLLSIYNSYEFQLNVADLCLLDTNHFRSAVIAIRGRVELCKEPHTLIKCGDRLFKMLANRFKQYRIDNRAKAFS